MNILKRINSKIVSIVSCIKTIAKLKQVKQMSNIESHSIRLRGAIYKDLFEISNIYKELNNANFSKMSEILLKYNEGKLIIVAEKIIKNEIKIVGIDNFYINPRDFKENTIHEGFIGVLPQYEGQGIATEMRKYSIEYFKWNGFSGISTRISKSNLGSLKSAEKLGFKIIEEYYDENMSEDRYYLVCNFNKAVSDE